MIMLEQSTKLLSLKLQQADLLLSTLKSEPNKNVKATLETELANLKDAIINNIIIVNADYDYVSESNAAYLRQRAELIIDYAAVIIDDITHYFDTQYYLSHLSRKVKKPNVIKSTSFNLGKRTITVRLTKP